MRTDITISFGDNGRYFDFESSGHSALVRELTRGGTVIDQVIVTDREMPADIEAIGCIVAAYLGNRELRGDRNGAAKIPPTATGRPRTFGQRSTGQTTVLGD